MLLQPQPGLLWLFARPGLAANGGVRQDGDAIGLHFQNAPGHEDELFAAIGLLDTHRAGLDTGDQRVCLGKMPNSPDSPGKATKRAAPEKMDSSALTTSTWMVFIAFPEKAKQGDSKGSGIKKFSFRYQPA